MKNKIDYVEIVKYLSGSMPIQERISFEQKMQHDDSLMEEVSFTNQLIKSIRYVGKKQTQKKIFAVQQDLKQEGFFLDSDDIEFYILGKMEKGERSIFEKKLEMDNSFKKEVENLKPILAGIKKVGKKNTKTKLSLIQENLEKEGFFNSSPKEKKKGRVIGMRKLLSLAAVFIGLLLIALWFLNRPPLEDRVFSEYFSLYQDVITPEISESGFALNGDENEHLLKAMSSYQEKDFSEAMNHLNGFLDGFSQSDFVPEVNLYRAIIYLNQKEYLLALPILQELEKDTNSYFLSSTQWYLALTYLKIKQNNKAISLFELLENDTEYGDKANAILKDLE